MIFKHTFVHIKSVYVLWLFCFSKIALVIIENGARWLVENFVLSRYNHRYNQSMFRRVCFLNEK